MASECIISATFGSPGSGKTYTRVRWLVEDFLVNNPDGMYITNIPLNISVIADHMSKVLTRNDRLVTPEQIAARLHVIPDDVLIYWEKLNQIENRDLNSFDSTTFPPTQYLQQFNLEGSHIAIDEFHKYFGKRSPKLLKKLWNDWFAEIRKTGCVFEGITQSYQQMAEEFLDKCSIRTELLNHSDLKDPFLYIRMGDWYELRAGLLGKEVLQRVTSRETIRSSTDSGKLSWHPTGKNITYVLSSDFFRFYDSFRNLTGVSGRRKSPAEIYGRKVIFWFLRRNFMLIVPKIILVLVVSWFLLGGGFVFLVKTIFSSFSFVGKQNQPVKEKVVEVKNPVVSSGSQSSNKTLTSKSTPEKSKFNSEMSLSKEQFERLKELEKENQAKLFLYKPALFFEDIIVLRNSYEVKVDYKFNDKGPYHGKKIIQINPKNRFYLLDDGTFVSMF